MMAKYELVGGAGYLSDESDFYGDDKAVARWEKKARRELKSPSQQVVSPVAKKRKIEVIEKRQDVKEETPTATPQSKGEDHVQDFLKSRPQISKLQSDFLQDRKPTAKPRARTVAGEEASDLVRRDHFKGCPQAWQQDETINDFLKRAPVADPKTAALGPWLWVSNPKISRSHQKQENKADPNAFIELGDALLEAFHDQRSKVEAQNPGKAVATITRKMGPYRDQLEDDLLSAAVKTGTTCGKWMMFPSSDDLPRYWRLVAEATSEGKLGPTSKVGTYEEENEKKGTLICVYTYDFTDIEDVRRVLSELRDLNLVGTPICYKPDSYTYLGVMSNNEYKLRASLWSSKEIFNNESKPLKDGPIARLKRRSQKIDSFLSS